jgi:hypothetical protein
MKVVVVAPGIPVLKNLELFVDRIPAQGDTTI